MYIIIYINIYIDIHTYIYSNIYIYLKGVKRSYIAYFTLKLDPTELPYRTPRFKKLRDHPRSFKSEGRSEVSDSWAYRMYKCHEEL